MPARCGTGESIYDRDLWGANASLRESVILQISKQSDAIFFAFFLRIYIFISESGKPCIRRKLTHLFAQDFVGDIRMA